MDTVTSSISTIDFTALWASLLSIGTVVGKALLVFLVCRIAMNLLLLPRWGYYGAAWARFIAEAAMVVVSYYLNRRFFPTPYDVRRIAEYVVLGVGLFLVSEALLPYLGVVMQYGVNIVIFATFAAYAVWREKIDVKAMLRTALRRR